MAFKMNYSQNELYRTFWVDLLSIIHLKISSKMTLAILVELILHYKYDNIPKFFQVNHRIVKIKKKTY